MKTFTPFFYIFLFLGTLLANTGSAYACKEVQPVKAAVASGQSDPFISIYPNPNKGIAKIRLNQPIEGNSRIRFSNTIGKVVKVVDLSSLTEGNEVSIDLTNLPAGVYFYSIVVNDKLVETKRLILEI